MNTTPQAALLSAHWYSIDKHGAATLCVDEDDAKATAIDSQTLYPHNGPYRAVQMAPIEPVHAGELLLQGGLTNEQLREAFGEKMPGVVPSDRDLTLFALGIEVGAAELADERRMKKMYFDERNSARDAWRRAADQREEARAALSARKPLTEEQRSKVFRDAETRMVYDLNLSWRNAVVDEVERAHGIGLEVKP